MSAEIPGAERYAQACPGQPPALSDEDVRALVARLPSADERERQFWGPLAHAHRAYGLCERARADSVYGLIRAHNQAVRGAE